MLFSLSLRGWANTTQQMSWERKGLNSQFEGTVRAREAWCQEYETHTQEGERDQCGSHPLMPLFPFYQYVTVAQNSACWGWVFPPQLVYLGIFSKTSPEGFFFLTDGSRSYTVGNVNHHCSTKWSHPCREPFLNPVSSCPQHRITTVKTVTFNYTRLLSPCLLIIWCIGLNLHSQCFRKPACAQYHCMAPPQIALSLMAHQLWDLVLNLVLLSSPAIFYT